MDNNTVILGLFTDSAKAGQAVSDLKEKGYTKDISLVARDMSGEAKTHQIKEDATEGAVVGGTLGALAAVIGLTFTPVTLPAGAGVVLVGGPLLSILGITSGALAGGLVGALVDLGFPKETAKDYESRVLRGEVLVAVTTDESKEADVKSILLDYDVYSYQKINR